VSNYLLFFEQTLNGIQLGVMLFLMASGLTLVFGIMRLINLAHGSFYMLGAYITAFATHASGSFLLGVLVALPIVAMVGALVEITIMRRLYERDHLDQILATFGLILFFNELVSIMWGPQAIFLPIPLELAGSVTIVPGVSYPLYRLFIIFIGLAVAILLRFLIVNTRTGALIRAGASNREMVEVLGVNIDRLYTILFALGALLAGVAGALVGPVLAIETGMGEHILIPTLIVLVIGGIGSVRGALIGAIVVGLADTYGRAFIPLLLRNFLTDNSLADSLGASFATMLVYMLLVVVLIVRPEGLFQAYK
jgi:branched-chain amino acid transport system permease protein